VLDLQGDRIFVSYTESHKNSWLDLILTLGAGFPHVRHNFDVPFRVFWRTPCCGQGKYYYAHLTEEERKLWQDCDFLVTQLMRCNLISRTQTSNHHSSVPWTLSPPPYVASLFITRKYLWSGFSWVSRKFSCIFTMEAETHANNSWPLLNIIFLVNQKGKYIKPNMIAFDSSLLIIIRIYFNWQPIWQLFKLEWAQMRPNFGVMISQIRREPKFWSKTPICPRQGKAPSTYLNPPMPGAPGHTIIVLHSNCSL
jgi:hypothetical protein